MRTDAVHTLLTAIDWRRAMGASAVVLSILSGKLGVGGELLSVRFICTLSAIVLLAPELRRMGFPAPVIAFVAFFGYMAVRSFVQSGSTGAAHQIDFAYLAIQSLLIMSARNGKIAVYMVMAAIGVCLLYFVAAIVGQALPNIGSGDKSGLGWGPIGTVITFSRLQFLGFVLALSLTKRHQSFWILAAIFLYATFSSILKAAILAACLSLFIIIAILAFSRMWKTATLLVVMAAVSFGSFQLTFGQGATKRFIKAAQTSTAVGDVKSADTGRFVITANYCTYGAEQSIVCKSRALADASGRLIMAAEALTGFMKNPVFGRGTEEYRVNIIHPETLKPETHPYPHNVILEIAHNGGLFGLTLFGISVIVTGRVIAASKVSEIYKASIFGLMTFALITALFGGDIYDARLLWLPALALASPRYFFPPSASRAVETGCYSHPT